MAMMGKRSRAGHQSLHSCTARKKRVVKAAKSAARNAMRKCWKRGPYVAGGRAQARKLKALMELITRHVGSAEGARAAVKELAGYDNKTTDSIKELWGALPRAQGSKKVRLEKAALLRPLTHAGQSRAKLRALGFDGVGQKMYATCVGNKAPQDGRKGRCAKNDAGAIYLEWHNRSYEHSSGGRVFYKTLDQVAGEVASAEKCSKSTPLRHRPRGLKRARRPEDLCPLCEELRSERVKSLKRSGWVAPVGADPDEAPCKTVQTWAAECEKPQELPKKLEPLLQHEALQELTCKVRNHYMHSDLGRDTLSVVLDWSAPVEFRDIRQTSSAFLRRRRML